MSIHECNRTIGESQLGKLSLTSRQRALSQDRNVQKYFQGSRNAQNRELQNGEVCRVEGVWTQFEKAGSKPGIEIPVIQTKEGYKAKVYQDLQGIYKANVSIAPNVTLRLDVVADGMWGIDQKIRRFLQPGCLDRPSLLKSSDGTQVFYLGRYGLAGGMPNLALQSIQRQAKDLTEQIISGMRSGISANIRNGYLSLKAIQTSDLEDPLVLALDLLDALCAFGLRDKEFVTDRKQIAQLMRQLLLSYFVKTKDQTILTKEERLTTVLNRLEGLVSIVEQNESNHPNNGLRYELEMTIDIANQIQDSTKWYVELGEAGADLVKLIATKDAAAALALVQKAFVKVQEKLGGTRVDKMLGLEILRLAITADPKNCEAQIFQVMKFLKEHKNDDWYTVYCALDVLSDVALNPEIQDRLRVLVCFSENDRDKSHIFDFCDHHEDANFLQRNTTQRDDWRLREKASEIAARLVHRQDTPAALKEAANAKILVRKNKENEDPRVKLGIDYAHTIDQILSLSWVKQENQQEAMLARILSLSEEIKQAHSVQEQKSLMEKIAEALPFIKESRSEIAQFNSLMEASSASNDKNMKQIEEKLKFSEDRSNQINQTLQSLCESVSLLRSNAKVPKGAEETQAQQRISEISESIEALGAECGINIRGNVSQQAGKHAVIAAGNVVIAPSTRSVEGASSGIVSIAQQIEAVKKLIRKAEAVPEKGAQFYQEAKQMLNDIIDAAEDDVTIDTVATLNKQITGALNLVGEQKQTSSESSPQRPATRGGIRIGGSVTQTAGEIAVISGGKVDI